MNTFFTAFSMWWKILILYRNSSGHQYKLSYFLSRNAKSIYRYSNSGILRRKQPSSVFVVFILVLHDENRLRLKTSTDIFHLNNAVELQLPRRVRVESCSRMNFHFFILVWSILGLFVWGGSARSTYNSIDSTTFSNIFKSFSTCHIPALLVTTCLSLASLDDARRKSTRMCFIIGVQTSKLI